MGKIKALMETMLGNANGVASLDENGRNAQPPATHAAQHAIGGSDQLKPVDIGALPRDGSAAMTGALKIVNASDTILGKTEIGTNYNYSFLRLLHDKTSSANYRQLQLYNKDASVGDCLRLYVVENGSAISSEILLHTGNKPQGSECFYYGNASLTRDPINTGGIGRAIMVYCNSGFAIVTPLGAIVATNGTITHLGSNEANFYEGTLTLHTQNGILNGSNNVQHFYQVL